MILHDYADDAGVEILNRLVAAKAPDSCLLISVMFMGGEELTKQGFASMLDAAELELVKLWRVGTCVESRLKQP
ncbi:hypothetical protein HRG_012758 [Hirsutella rhossiliensis]